MSTLFKLLTVAAGGAIGSSCRYIVELLMPDYKVWAVLVANLSGCVAIGIISAVLYLKFPNAVWCQLFVVTGLLGGYTTMSSFALQSFSAMESGQFAWALGYIVATVVGGVLLCGLSRYLTLGFLQ